MGLLERRTEWLSIPLAAFPLVVPLAALSLTPSRVAAQAMQEPPAPATPEAPVEQPPAEVPVDLASICPGSTRTAPAPSADRAVGRPAFVEGLAAVEDERWHDAVVDFGRSYELSGSPVALYNMALALRALGAHRRARDAFCTLAQNEALEDAEMRAESRMLAGREQEGIAFLVLTLEEPERGVTVAIDGEEIVVAQHERTFELDAEHPYDLVLAAPGHLSLGMPITLAIDERRRESVRLERVLERLEDSPVFWGLVGGGIALVVVGVVIGVVVAYFEAQLDGTHSATVSLP